MELIFYSWYKTTLPGTEQWWIKRMAESRFQLTMLTKRSLTGACNLTIICFFFFFLKQSIWHLSLPKTTIPNQSLMVTFSEWVKGVYHELEDAIPHETVVEGGRTSTSLEARLSLSRETKDTISSQKWMSSASQKVASSSLWPLISIIRSYRVEPKNFKVSFKCPKDVAFLLHESIFPTLCALLTKEVSIRQAMCGMLHTIHSLSSQNEPHGINTVSINLKSLTSEVRFWVTQTKGVGYRCGFQACFS